MSFRQTLDQVLSDPNDVQGAIAYARLNHNFNQTKYSASLKKPKRPNKVKKPKNNIHILTSVRSKKKRVGVSVSPRLTTRKINGTNKRGGKK